MNKILFGLIAGLTLICAAPASAQISSDSDAKFAIPGAYGSGARDIFAKWAPAKRSVSETAAAKVAATGTALLLDAVCTTTTADEDAYVTVFNQASVSGITSTATGKDPLVKVKAKVLAASNRDSGRDSSCQFFPVPIPADTGLTFINSSASQTTSIIYRVISR